MRNVLAALALASVAAAACASSLSPSVSPSKLLAATKQLSAKDCHPHAYFSTDLYVSRCVYSPAAFIDGKWSVMVHFVVVDKSGKYVGAMGTDAVYVFNKVGKFVKIIPGM
ncbi:MAG: hypothetical protein ACRD5Z_01680 [Bryobacteraceae bacterium]